MFCPFWCIFSKENSSFVPVFLFSPLLRTESSSTWRASTTRRWSTTPFWLTADTHTLTRTHSITATLGDAERGTASRSASADRNHSSSLHFFLPLLSGCKTLALRLSRRRVDRQTEDQRPAVFTLGLHDVEQQPSALHLPPTISTFPFLHDFCSQFCSFSIILLSVLFLIFVSGRFLLFLFIFVGLNGDAIAKFLTSSWPLQPSCLWFSVRAFFFVLFW